MNLIEGYYHIYFHVKSSTTLIARALCNFFFIGHTLGKAASSLASCFCLINVTCASSTENQFHFDVCGGVSIHF